MKKYIILFLLFVSISSYSQINNWINNDINYSFEDKEQVFKDPNIKDTLYVDLDEIEMLKGGVEMGSALPEWAKEPYFALPKNGVSLLSGTTVTLYGDALITVSLENNLHVYYSCDIGSVSGNNYTITATDADTGSHQIIMRFYNNNAYITRDTINITVHPKAPDISKKIMLVGNSITLEGSYYYTTQIRSILSTNISFLGTQGSSYSLHEGYGGATWLGFETGTHGKFYNSITHKLDLPNYFTTNSIDTPDYVIIRLGVNDTFTHCNINGDGLTDGEITTIINRAKILIDSLLKYDTNLKIILEIPTICENTGAGWDANYDDAANQNLYIKNIHKYWKVYINTFANGVYNSRVDCSYAAIELDRNDGYPKTNGIHTNGIHPDQSGYEQMAVEMASAINKRFKYDLKPSALTATWVKDYDSISWTDNTTDIAQHEIWTSCQDSAYRLLTVIDAGTDFYKFTNIHQNASYKFKVRAKYNNWYSTFSSVVSQNTPLVFKTNQSTLTDVIFQLLTITTGKTVNIDWGDGTNANYTGSNTTITKTYSIAKNPYYIQISGDVNYITELHHDYQILSYGDLSAWILPTRLTYFHLGAGINGNFSGDISAWVLPSTLTRMQISNSNFTGNISNWIIPAEMIDMSLASDDTYKLTGDLSNFIIPSTMTRFYVPKHDFTKLPRGEYKNFDASIGLFARENNCNQAEIDALLVDMDNYFTTNTPIKNSLFVLDGTGMATPSATGLAARTSIINKYTAAGFTATIIVNP